jgi:hypothetical protein
MESGFRAPETAAGKGCNLIFFIFHNVLSNGLPNV